MTRTLLCFGDSNTHGTMALNELGDMGRFERNKRWPGRLAKALGDDWHVIEEGHPGRTTVHDDPIEGPHRNGATVLPSILESHRPIDVVILMLGTNDLKPRFSLTSADIALSVEKLIKLIQASDTGKNAKVPKIVLVSPVPIIETGCLAAIFEGGAEKSKPLAGLYKDVAKRMDVAFFDAGSVAECDPADGVHLSKKAHKNISNALLTLIKRKFPMTYIPNPDRYSKMVYNRCGASGLKLPAISLGLWHNFGGDSVHDTKRAICQTAFDEGITHFDLANNYGPPPGSAETAFGEILRTDFNGLRDELIISSKAGYLMWGGPYGEWGSRKYLISSCDQSLKRMGLDYVDIFYSHRFDPDTPLEETMGALDHIVRSGRALYAGISSYNSQKTREAAAILKDLGTPCVIHQPSYNMINRWVEKDGLKDTLKELGIGSIAFTPLAQGMLTSKYLKGTPEGSRATQGKSLKEGFLNEKTINNIRKLNEIAERRGQTLAQMALAWVLRDGGITTALIGASKPEQVIDCARAVDNLSFTTAELKEIDTYADEENINLWAKSSES